MRHWHWHIIHAHAHSRWSCHSIAVATPAPWTRSWLRLVRLWWILILMSCWCWFHPLMKFDFWEAKRTESSRLSHILSLSLSLSFLSILSHVFHSLFVFILLVSFSLSWDVSFHVAQSSGILWSCSFHFIAFDVLLFPPMRVGAVQRLAG